MSCQTVTFEPMRRMVGALKPDIACDWYDDNDAIIDFTGASFRLRVGKTADGPHLLEKTTNITGAATLPNVRIVLTQLDLNALPEVDVPYVWQLRCTSDGNRAFPDFVVIFEPGQS